MSKGASARRYAQAAFEIALENDEFDAWLEDLSYLAAALQSDEFSGFLDAPQVAVSQKIKLIDETVAGTISPLSRNLLALLASRNSAHLVPSITGAYQGMLDAHRGLERAEIESAVPPSSGRSSLGRLQSAYIARASFTPRRISRTHAQRSSDRICLAPAAVRRTASCEG